MQYRPEYDMKLIGCNLKRLRETKKLTVDKVRRYLRLASVQTIYKYEAGKCYPSVDVMFALMQLYDADLYDVLCETEDGKDSASLDITKAKQMEPEGVLHK